MQTDDDNHLLSGLNEAQRQAVEYCGGPSLVIAGAGSGKTRVLTYKIAYLLQHGMEPWSIMALTFTNKAADEMKRRIGSLVGEQRSRYLWMGTFHSIFLRILRYEHEAIGFAPNFTIYDASDSRSLLKSIIREQGLDDKLYKPANVAARISSAKNRLVSATVYAANPDLLAYDRESRMPHVADIYTAYAERLRQSNAMDFDDILLFTYVLFDTHPDICQKYADRLNFVLVDEYQDTNYAQHLIVWQLTHERQMVCAVGDDAQSIYSFRGAEIDNILKFREFYPSMQLFKLEQNYRSTQTIVNAANSLISHNRNQIEKTVYSQLEVGEPILFTQAYSDVEEGTIVLRKLQELHRREHIDYDQFAILYRTNAQSRIFEEALRKSGVPYRIVGGLSFYQRKEIKDIIAYMRLAVNPNDEEALRRVINYPRRGIGDTTVDKIAAAAVEHHVSLWQTLCAPEDYGLTVNAAARNKLKGFADIVTQTAESAARDDAFSVAKLIMSLSGVYADIVRDNTPEGMARRENVDELMSGLQEFVTSRQEEGNSDITLSDYLSEVSLLSDVEEGDSDDERRVTLMTVHAAKGLEFHTVFVVGMEENLFPNQMAMASQRGLEEERRLFYVAITRAKRHCFLSSARSRYRFGKLEFGNPSRFISNIDERYLTTGGSDRRDRNAGYGSARRNFDNLDDFLATLGLQSDEASVARPSRPRFNPSPAASGSTSSAGSASPSAASPRSTQAEKRPSAATTSTSFRPGDIVIHPRFGRGRVVSTEGEGNKAKAMVNFENVGMKLLLLCYAKLQLAE